MAAQLLDGAVPQLQAFQLQRGVAEETPPPERVRVPACAQLLQRRVPRYIARVRWRGIAQQCVVSAQIGHDQLSAVQQGLEAVALTESSELAVEGEVDFREPPGDRIELQALAIDQRVVHAREHGERVRNRLENLFLVNFVIRFSRRRKESGKDGGKDNGKDTGKDRDTAESGKKKSKADKE